MHRKRFTEWPLVFFTVLSQMSAGMFFLWGLLALFVPDQNSLREPLFVRAVLIAVLGILALGGLAAFRHLGRPVGAVYSLHRWRKSSLSQEALLAGGYGASVMVVLALQLFRPGFDWLDRFIIAIGCLLAVSLVVGISWLYRIRTVPAWDHPGTTAEFILTALLTGSAGLLALGVSFSADALNFSARWLIPLLVFAQLVVFAGKLLRLRRNGRAGQESAVAMLGPMRGGLILRWGILLAVCMLLIPGNYSLLVAALVLLSEILGRAMFYASSRRYGL